MAGTRAIDVLRQVPFLRDIDETGLARVADGLLRREFASGQEILRQGTAPDGLYLLQQGEVEMLRRRAREAQPERTARFVPGDLFGEMELLVRRPRAATIRALTPVVVYFWERRALLTFLRRHPSALASFRLAVSSRQKALRLRLGWLEEGEVVYGLTNKHPILLERALLLPTLILSAGTVLGLAALSGAVGLSGWVAGGLALAGLGLGLWQWIDWGNDYYVVTDRRAVWMEKVVGLYDSRQEAPLRMVLSVSVTTEAIGRIFDYGDVVIRTYTGQIVFRSVPSPRAMAALIEEHWRRTQLRVQRADRQTIDQALEQGLDQTGEVESAIPTLPPPPDRAPRSIGLDRWTFQLRFEDQGVITYRKHWAVLLRATFTPALLILVVVGMIGAGL
ncbi:MAG: cyclic nucleotide-binding domain-containing protein, partial [Chloroflexota bacterium]